MDVGTIILLPALAGVLVRQRGYRPLGILLELIAYVAAAVWAVVDSPFVLLLLIAAPMPAMHTRAVARGRRRLALACDVIGLAALLGALATISVLP